jgi:hypothetical protein
LACLNNSSVIPQWACNAKANVNPTIPAPQIKIGMTSSSSVERFSCEEGLFVEEVLNAMINNDDEIICKVQVVKANQLLACCHFKNGAYSFDREIQHCNPCHHPT